MTTPCHFAIFGAAGHLATTKLLPALYGLEAGGRLDEALGFVALARRDWDTASWREHLLTVLAQRHGDALDVEAVRRLAERFEYVGGDHRDPRTYRALFDTISRPRPGACENLVFYLAVPRASFST